MDRLTAWGYCSHRSHFHDCWPPQLFSGRIKMSDSLAGRLETPLSSHSASFTNRYPSPPLASPKGQSFRSTLASTTNPNLRQQHIQYPDTARRVSPHVIHMHTSIPVSILILVLIIFWIWHLHGTLETRLLICLYRWFQQYPGFWSSASCCVLIPEHLSH